MKEKEVKILLLALILVFIGLVNFWFLAKDNIPPVHDANVCYSASYSYYQRFVNGEKTSSLIELFDNWNFYPPAYMFLPLPFYAVSNGPDPDTMALVNIVYLLLLIVAVYRIGKYLYDDTAGIISVVILFLFPAVMGFSRITHLNIAQASLVTINFYFLLRSDSFKQRRYSILSGILAGIGMLFSLKHGIYIFGIVLFSLVAGPGFKKRIVNFMLFFVLAVLVSAVYYLPAFLCGSGLANPRLTVPGFVSSYFDFSRFLGYVFQYILMFKKHLLIPNFIMFLAALPAVLLLSKNRKQPLLLLAWLGFPVLILAFSAIARPIGAQPRYLLSLLPPVAILIGSMLWELNSRLNKRFPAVIFMLVLIVANIIFLPKQHPFPKDSYELLDSRHHYGMLHAVQKDSPAEELFSLLEKTGRDNMTVLVVSACGDDVVPLVVQMFYDRLRDSDLNIEMLNPMDLAIIAYYKGMAEDEKEKYLGEYFDKANYVLYIESDGEYLTAARSEYYSRYNDILKELFVNKQDRMELIWEYNDKDGFFKERLYLLMKTNG